MSAVLFDSMTILPPAPPTPRLAGNARPAPTPNNSAAATDTRAANVADTVELSPRAAKAAAEARQPHDEQQTGDERPSQDGRSEAPSEAAAPKKPNGQPLSEEEQQQVQDLKQRDREVRAHEQAHVAAAGPYAQGGPSYSYQKGPDGNRYAVGGSVSIDSSPVKGDPEATIRKMQVVKAAALAPAEPSAQDRKVAAQASQAEAQARRELQAQKQQEREAQKAEVKEAGDGRTSSTRAVDPQPASPTDTPPTRSAITRAYAGANVSKLESSIDLLA